MYGRRGDDAGMGKRAGVTGATYKDGRRVEVVLSGGMGEGAKFSPGAGVECRGCRGASPSARLALHTHCASPARAHISLPCCCLGHIYPAVLAGILGVLYNCVFATPPCALPRPTSPLQAQQPVLACTKAAETRLSGSSESGLVVPTAPCFLTSRTHIESYGM